MCYPTVIADLGGQYSYLPFMSCTKILYTCSSNGSQSRKICIGSHVSYVYRLGNSFMLVLCDKQEQRDSFANAEEGILKCILCHSSTILPTLDK